MDESLHINRLTWADTTTNHKKSNLAVLKMLVLKKTITTLIRMWKSGFQCHDHKNEETDLINNIVRIPWMGRWSRRKQNQLKYIPQGHLLGGRPHGQRGLHWCGPPPCWTSAIPGHPAAFSVSVPTFSPALCPPQQASPWTGGHL